MKLEQQEVPLQSSLCDMSNSRQLLRFGGFAGVREQQVDAAKAGLLDTHTHTHTHTPLCVAASLNLARAPLFIYFLPPSLSLPRLVDIDGCGEVSACSAAGWWWLATALSLVGTAASLLD